MSGPTDAELATLLERLVVATERIARALERSEEGAAQAQPPGRIGKRPKRSRTNAQEK